MRRRSSGSGIAGLTGVVLLILVVTGCGVARRPADTGSAPVIGVSPVRSGHDAQTADHVVTSRCPAGVHGCRSAEGRIVYVEGHDPDGNGDAHFVIADSQGITLPGLTAIDVREGLRPQPLPRVGALVSAAGPLQDGSVGESEIHALEVHVAR